MSEKLQPGLKGEARVIVNEGNTAIAQGSGSVSVFATPAMVALMENAALSSVDPLLEPGFTTVGTKMKVKHLAATPVGMGVVATSQLVKADGKKLKFEIEVYDDNGLVGEGEHERYVVETSTFLQKVEAKLMKN